VVVFRDATARHELARMKDQFISTMTHELRTPLTAINGSLGLLAGGMFGQLAPKGQHMLEVALKNAQRLMRLINEILDYERLRAGHVTLELKPTQVQMLAQTTVDSLVSLAEQKGIRLAVDAPEEIVLLDPDRIQQVLTNLIGNALKFSPADSTVTVKVEREGAEVAFAVIDQGRGIPPEKVGRIFERFEQVAVSDAKEKGGTGLGLAISQAIVTQHRGRIWVESVVDQGSAFRFVLPAEQPALPEPASEPVPVRDAGPA
jgi:signal transduction histidine kinase